jgi:hypothetical protein
MKRAEVEEAKAKNLDTVVDLEKWIDKIETSKNQADTNLYRKIGKLMAVMNASDALFESVQAEMELLKKE